MPSILADADKETVKRTVPKASNKIQAVAVARLYVAHPNNRNRWTYTGLQGAAVLADDLVGKTFWIKLVDISPANRGVIWDQEIYDSFAYNQDRTFFHSFELEQCLAGLSFVDDKEAKQFLKKMNEREKNASRGTKGQPFGSSQQGGAMMQSNGGGGHSHSRIGNFLRGNRHTSNPPPPAQSMIAQQPQAAYSPVSRPTSAGIDLADPSWRPMLLELKQMGITEDQIEANAEFIKDYVAQKQAQELANGIAPAIQDRSRAPPPPPPAAPPGRLSPQNTSATTASRRGPPPAPPPSRRPVGGRTSSPPRSSSPPRTPSPESPAQPAFRVPPPFANAGKFAVPVGRDMHSSGRQRASSNLVNPGPPPPPRPPKVEVEEDKSSPGFRVPPPFTGDRKSSAPPATPSRGPVPPPPPSRDSGPPPPLPPKTPTSNSAYIPPPPPPPPNRNSGPPPPLPPPNARPIPPPPAASSGAPPPPPMPNMGGPPPPPPMPNMGGPPPPPPMPGGGSAPPLPKPSADRGGLLSEIRGTGGAGVLKKVPDHVKRDRSAAAVPGSDGAAPPPPSDGSPAPVADQGGLAGALAAALSKRKKKVSGSGMCLSGRKMMWTALIV
jgi:neural Wiskott-Aldrich syndrome protein